ncbi:hypothetical protein [Azospirillum picis]|uniref:Uncharacterized protein n=1 Tax=Azospirillum picis TaxID=488438 RepID=A0ABU0MNV2_9PROT|nr:hypothetical protein [Azospirillum picis]MBP2301314.1 hypothetical protein [Azospirillum picis]MDQ0535145.1 hypothetical protein [Azospirillum picis]
MSGQDRGALCRILDRNLALEGTLRGNGWVHLDDVLMPTVIEDVARWTSSGIATLDIVTPARDPVTALMVSGTTLRRDVRVRITYALDNNAQVLAPGAPAPVWRRALGRAWQRKSLDWSARNWWMGRPSARDMAGYAVPIIDLPPRCRPAVTRIEIDNGGDPFDLGHLFLAAALVPEWGFDWGRDITPQSRSKLDVTPGGGRIVAYQRPQRVQTLTFEDLTDDEAAAFQDLSMRLDKVGPVAVIPEPKKTRHVWREAYVGFLAESVTRRQVANDLWRASLKVEEMVG